MSSLPIIPAVVPKKVPQPDFTAGPSARPAKMISRAKSAYDGSEEETDGKEKKADDPADDPTERSPSARAEPSRTQRAGGKVQDVRRDAERDQNVERAPADFVRAVDGEMLEKCTGQDEQAIRQHGKKTAPHKPRSISKRLAAHQMFSMWRA